MIAILMNSDSQYHYKKTKAVSMDALNEMTG